MTVSGGILIAPAVFGRIFELQRVDDRCRTHVKDFAHDFFKFIISKFAGAVSGNIYAQRFGYADSVCHLDLALVSQTGSHDVFGNVTAHVSSGTVDLAGVFAGKCTAAVRADAAVGIHNDLSAGQTGIAVGTADFKFAGGVDKVFDLFFAQFSREGIL